MPAKKNKATIRKKMSIEEPGHGLNELQIKFCKLYAQSDIRGNGVRCYAAAYDFDLNDKGGYAAAKAGATRALTNDSLLSYIRFLFEDRDMNDTVVDNELAFVLKQNADFGSKLGAIKEYNVLKNRIKNKMEVEINQAIPDDKLAEMMQLIRDSLKK